MRFSIGGALNDELILTDGVLEFEAKASYTVTVRVTDSGGLSHDETITVNVDDLNEAPTAITPTSFNINENVDTSSGTSVGTLVATDEDAGESFTYSVIGGADQAKFSIGGALNDELILTDGTLNFESQPEYSVRVRVTDSFGNTYDETITVNVNDVNEAPTAITPTSFRISENVDASSGLKLGKLNATDPDNSETFTYSIQGGADQAKFSLGGADGKQLILTEADLDFDTQSSYSVIVRVTDSGGNTYDQTIVVNVSDVPIPIQPNDDAGDGDPVEETDEGDTESGGGNPADNRGGESENPPSAQDPRIPISSVPDVYANESSELEVDEESESTPDLVEIATTYALAAGNQAINAVQISAPSEMSIAVGRYVSDALLAAMNDLRVEVDQDEFLNQIVIGTTLTASASITAGYVIWLIRGGVLISSVLSSLPAWRMVDPLPVLSYLSETSEEEDDDSLEALVKKSNSGHEEVAV